MNNTLLPALQVPPRGLALAAIKKQTGLAGRSEAHCEIALAKLELPCSLQVTYHGPGQLVMYPILNLRLFNPDLHWYLRSLEEVVIR